jgi:hypothetical protein
MYGEPKNRADILQDAAAMANGNLRLTRVLNLLLLHLTNRPAPVSDPELSGWENAACHALDVLSVSWDDLDEQGLESALTQLESLDFDRSSAESDSGAWVFAQLGRGSTELTAMIIDLLPDRVSQHSPPA